MCTQVLRFLGTSSLAKYVLSTWLLTSFALHSFGCSFFYRSLDFTEFKNKQTTTTAVKSTKALNGKTAWTTENICDNLLITTVAFEP